jgi:hypothetical protein
LDLSVERISRVENRVIMVGNCAFCGKEFRAKRSDAKTCSQRCRDQQKARNKINKQAGGAGQIAGRVGMVSPIPDPSPGRPSLVFDVTQQALVKAGRLSTPLAAVALVLAGRLDNSGFDTGSGVVALSRELDRLLVDVLAQNEPPDELDELEERRREKAARAGL